METSRKEMKYSLKILTPLLPDSLSDWTDEILKALLRFEVFYTVVCQVDLESFRTLAIP